MKMGLVTLLNPISLLLENELELENRWLQIQTFLRCQWSSTLIIDHLFIKLKYILLFGQANA